jgi:valyl-tRNA synthetase
MPFVTEAIWEHLRPLMGTDAEALLISAKWPDPSSALSDAAAERSMETVMDVTRAIRNVRAEKNVKADRWIAADVAVADPALHDQLVLLQESIGQLARVRPLQVLASVADASRESAVSAVLSGAEVLVPMAGLFDVADERSRLEKQLVESEAELLRLANQLANDAFRARAPANVVAGIEEKHAVARERIDGLKRSLAELGRG